MTTAADIKVWLETAMADCQVMAEGDGHHFSALVVSPSFVDRSTMERHRMVYQALGNHMQTDIHALSLKTFTPEEYQQHRSNQ